MVEKTDEVSQLAAIRGSSSSPRKIYPLAGLAGDELKVTRDGQM